MKQERTFSIASHNKAIPLALVITVLALATIAVGKYVQLRSAETLKASAVKEPSTFLSQEAGRNERVETELITITSTGFEPAELTRPAGKFLLEVDNRSEIEEVELRLDREQGGREKSPRIRRTAPEWGGAFDLPPGVYILSEATHPNWICRITLTPH